MSPDERQAIADLVVTLVNALAVVHQADRRGALAQGAWATASEITAVGNAEWALERVLHVDGLTGRLNHTRHFPTVAA